MSALIKAIEESEGFRGLPYDDHLGNPTIGYGTLLPISKYEARLILEHRLYKMINELLVHKSFVSSLSQEVKYVIYEMCYQLGVPRLLMFKRMWKALEAGDYKEAAKEGLDSRWARQTPNRANRIMNRLKLL